MFNKHIIVQTAKGGGKAESASTESSAQLRAERKADQQMGRPGRGERGNPSIFRRIASVNGQPVCWHRAKWPEFSGKQGGTAETTLSVLVPLQGNKDFFISEGIDYETITGKTMVGLTS